MGIFFNYTKMLEKVTELETQVSELTEEIYALAGCKFKIGSSQQYADILINRFGVEPRLLNRNGKLYTNKDVLAEVQKVMDVPIIDKISTLKTISTKLTGLTGDKGIIKFIKPTTLKTDGGDEIVVVIPKISILETGRYQFSNPNISNLTPEIMELMVAPAGYTIVAMDIRQQEPTVMFNGVLNCVHFKKLFKENLNDKYIAIAKLCIAQNRVINKINEFVQVTGLENIDESMWVYRFLLRDGVTHAFIKNKKKQHCINHKELNDYIVVHEIPYTECDAELRDAYKLALLSGSYGAYEASLKSKVGEEVGASFYRMLDMLPEMVDYKERAGKYIRSGGRNVMTLFGTELKLNEYDSKGQKRNFNALLRLMQNYPNQGTGADMLKFVICDFYDWQKENNLPPMDIRIMTTRHDEIVLLVKDELLDRIDEVKDFMELQVEDWAPILVKVKQGKTYPIAS